MFQCYLVGPQQESPVPRKCFVSRAWLRSTRLGTDTCDTYGHHNWCSSCLQQLIGFAAGLCFLQKLSSSCSCWHTKSLWCFLRLLAICWAIVCLSMMENKGRLALNSYNQWASALIRQHQQADVWIGWASLPWRGLVVARQRDSSSSAEHNNGNDVITVTLLECAGPPTEPVYNTRHGACWIHVKRLCLQISQVHPVSTLWFFRIKSLKSSFCGQEVRDTGRGNKHEAVPSSLSYYRIGHDNTTSTHT